MGFRKLRGRLDQVQGNANETMALAQDLLADLKDGFGVRIVVDQEKATEIFLGLFNGTLAGPIELPLTIRIVPEED